jgi:AcrR family transcriptional regulator
MPKPSRQPDPTQPGPEPTRATEADPTRAPRPPRIPLSRERVLHAALALADEHGLEAVSMRRLGQALGVEAMSLYKHVADKEAILDGLVDLVMDEVEVPHPGLPWREAIRRSAISMHAAMRRHPWAGLVMESRINPGPARLRYLNAVVGVLRGAGFEPPMIARAFMALDSHTYGFTMQELSLPIDAVGGPELSAMMAGVFEPYPNLVVMAELAASGAPMLDFEFGLDLLLDGLERLRPTA